MSTRVRLFPLASILALALWCALAAATASADFGFKTFAISATDAEGHPYTQAGGHPFAFSTNVEFNTKPADNLHPNEASSPTGETTDGNVKDVRVDLPVGFAGNPTSFPRCPEAELLPLNGEPTCPPASQVGVLKLRATADYYQFGIYNVPPPPGYAAEFASLSGVPGVRIRMLASVASAGDDHIIIDVVDANQAVPVFDVETTFWGVPADPRHDWIRGPGVQCPPEAGPPTPCAYNPNTSGGYSSGLVPRPLLTMPTQCDTPPTVTVHGDSWQQPGVWAAATAALSDTSTPPLPLTLTGCDELPFGAGLSVQSDTASTDSPQGLTVHVHTPQPGQENPNVLGSAPLRDTTVTLPAGTVVNPARARGLSACSLADGAIGTDEAAHCPGSSKIGTAKVETPLLDQPLEGGVYVLQSNPPDVKLLVAPNAEGANLKLVGVTHLDETTGQITATFADTPQLPFEDLTMNIEGGPRSALISAPQCGPQTVQGVFTPWTSPLREPVSSSSSFSLDHGPGGGDCPGALPFSPSVNAGSTEPRAGEDTGFRMVLQRADGQQRVSTVGLQLPPGLAARLRGVPLCSGADAAAGNCPAGSMIGHVVVGAGAGGEQLYLPQPGGPQAPIYLTDGYEGAPFGLAIVVPVVAGPFDLGTVVVRGAIQVDPKTAAVSVHTDPLPTILKGVPTDVRTIVATIDRPAFMVNPTDCAPTQVRSQVGSVSGDVVSGSTRFAISGCGKLDFAPRLSLKLQGREAGARGTSPKLLAHLKMEEGDANLAGAQVTLPHSEFLEQSHIGTICTRVQFAAHRCPAASIYGHAKAVSPLLKSPLRGAVYLRSSNHVLPDLVADLHGEVEIEVAARIDSVDGGRMRTTFESVPDVPVSSFDLAMKGGSKGLLVNSRDVCHRAAAAKAAFTGQNGAQLVRSVRMKVSCSRSR
jgi:hypothetical protein